MASIVLKQREAKTIAFIISGTFSLATASFRFGFKKKKDIGQTATVLKTHTDFDLTDIASRKIRISLSGTETDIDAGYYYGELEITFNVANLDKSADIGVEIVKSVLDKI